MMTVVQKALLATSLLLLCSRQILSIPELQFQGVSELSTWLSTVLLTLLCSAAVADLWSSLGTSTAPIMESGSRRACHSTLLSLAVNLQCLETVREDLIQL